MPSNQRSLVRPILLLLVFLTLCQLASARRFGQPVIYPAGNTPTAITGDDFNSDGYLDLAVANSLSNDVSVLPGNSDGTFQPAVNYPVGLGPVQLTVTCETLANSAVLDLAVVNSESNTVSILVGNSDGTFQPAVNYGVGSGLNPGGVIGFLDFNDDGNCDLAVVNAGGGTNDKGNIAVLLGNGDGTYQPAVNYDTLGSGPVSLIASDFNGDPYWDLAVADSASNSVSILFGDAKGGFTAVADYVVGTGPTSIAPWVTGGRVNLVTANSGSNDITVLYRTGALFDHVKSFAAGLMPVSAAQGVFNGTFREGLVIANEGDNTISVFPGKLHRPFLRNPITFPTCTAPKFVAAVGLRGQHDEDVLVACTEGVGVMLNTGP